MLEPQWNPSIEEQAMARIHRIGQTQAVTTIRYVMENSLEEVGHSLHISIYEKDSFTDAAALQHILNVQDRKKLLATLLLSNDSSSQVSDSSE